VKLKHGIIVKVLKVWAQVENRGPRTMNMKLMVTYWSLRKVNIKNWLDCFQL